MKLFFFKKNPISGPYPLKYEYEYCYITWTRGLMLSIQLFILNWWKGVRIGKEEENNSHVKDDIGQSREGQCRERRKDITSMKWHCSAWFSCYLSHLFIHSLPKCFTYKLERCIDILFLSCQLLPIWSIRVCPSNRCPMNFWFLSKNMSKSRTRLIVILFWWPSLKVQSVTVLLSTSQAVCDNLVYPAWSWLFSYLGRGDRRIETCTVPLWWAHSCRSGAPLHRSSSMVHWTCLLIWSLMSYIPITILVDAWAHASVVSSALFRRNVWLPTVVHTSLVHAWHSYDQACIGNIFIRSESF